MKRQIVIKLFGEEIVNVLIDESEEESDEIETESTGSLGSSDYSVSNKSSVGFNTPWSVEYWDDED